MKTYCLLCLSMFWTTLFEATGASLSATNNGIYVAVASMRPDEIDRTNGAIPYEAKLIWCPYSAVGYRRIPYGNPNYAFRVKMLGPDGKESVRTELGEKVRFPI